MAGFQDLGAKSHWIIEAASPARKLGEATERVLADLPSEVTPGARQVAILTRHRAAQAELLEPVMAALRDLEAMADWSRGFMVFDHVNTTWRDAPFKHYASFANFYQQELAETWGERTKLQETYRKYKGGDLTPEETEAALKAAAAQAKQEAEERKRGGDRKSEAARIKRDITLDPLGTRGSASYRLRRMARLKPDVLDRYERGDFPSVDAAYRHAFALNDLRAAWKCASAEDREAFLREVT